MVVTIMKLLSFVIILQTFLSAESGRIERRDARSFFNNLKRDFDINFKYQLQKLGFIQSNRRSVNTTQKCYDHLGCLEINEDWYGLTRPVNALPQDRKEINTQFFLHTRDNPKGELLNCTSGNTLEKSSYNATKLTKIIIHGYIDSAFVPWVQEMSDALLLAGDFNVISVDWGNGSSAIYSQSASNTRLVGLEVAHLIEMLNARFSVSPDSFHIIGHSLGSHIAGYAGEKIIDLMQDRGVNEKLGRISALDPAEPFFESMPRFVRLDDGDASFVDVIHTDAKSILMLGYGMVQPVGHVDFYPNGGSDQPGCSFFDLPGSMLDPEKAADSFKRHMVACSHNRAVELYTESIKSKGCDFIGHKCDSYSKYKQGGCFSCDPDGSNCAIMGFRANEHFAALKNKTETNVKFYLETGKSSPFCQFEYLLKLNLAKAPDSENRLQGYLKVNLHGSKGEMNGVDLTPEPLLLESSNVTFVFGSVQELGQLTEVSVMWTYHRPYSYCIWYCDGDISIANVVVKNMTNVSSVWFRHGKQKPFHVSLDHDLGHVSLVNVNWVHDKSLTPLNILRSCVFNCNDELVIKHVQVDSVKYKSLNNSFYGEEVEVCGDSSGSSVSRIKSGEWKLFYKRCDAV